MSDEMGVEVCKIFVAFLAIEHTNIFYILDCTVAYICGCWEKKDSKLL